LLIIALSCPRSSSVNVTLYFFISVLDDKDIILYDNIKVT
jgi:hypothetical protein